MMTAVGDQATAERSSSKTAKETVKLRQLVSKEQMLGIDLQNELAKLQVCMLHITYHVTVKEGNDAYCTECAKNWKKLFLQ